MKKSCWVDLGPMTLLRCWNWSARMALTWVGGSKMLCFMRVEGLDFYWWGLV